jgi:hypothetical protein
MSLRFRVYGTPSDQRKVDFVESKAVSLPVREYGKAMSCRPRDKELTMDRAREEGERFLHKMAEVCPILYATDIEVVDGPHLDVLRRYELVGWRFSAASPTIEFFQQFQRPEPKPETVWQHARRAWREWWGRQRGRQA